VNPESLAADRHGVARWPVAGETLDCPSIHAAFDALKVTVPLMLRPRRWVRQGCGKGAAYNREMLHTLQALVAPALAERLTLVINHVLNGEPVATERLRAHQGRTLAFRISGWPALLPAPPALAWCISPAGLLEWCGLELPPAPDLAVLLDAPNPALMLAKLLAGEAPAVQIDGDAQLAADVNWLMQNLRWDVAADLERLFGPTLSPPLYQVGSMLAAALRKAVDFASASATPSAAPAPSSWAGRDEPQRSRGL
jgi:ubiquinone biosynthesis accessory factor UbiJ